jgi:hypothetical protein
MNNITFRVVDTFPEPAFSTLTEEASDYEPSKSLIAYSAHGAAMTHKPSIERTSSHVEH